MRSLFLSVCISICAAGAVCSAAEDPSKPQKLQLLVGAAVPSSSGKAAGDIRVIFQKDYYRFSRLKQLQPGQNPPRQGEGWGSVFTPEVGVEMSGGDAFSAVVAKVGGMSAHFNYGEVPGFGNIPRPDWLLVYQLGVETDQRGRNPSALLEIGGGPILVSSGGVGMKPTPFAPELLAALQFGYKSKMNSSAESGGKVDQSAETPDSNLFRAKLGIQGSYLLAPQSDFKPAINYEATGWRDFVNGRYYHKLSAGLLISVGSARYSVFEYENGSGAPNFNKGDQWSTHLDVSF